MGDFFDPTIFNFVWGVAGRQRFRPEAFVALAYALPPQAGFTTSGFGRDKFSAIMQSCIMRGNMRVGLEDNVRVPNGDLARGNDELVEWAVRLADLLGREPATPDEACKIMGIRGN